MKKAPDTGSEATLATSCPLVFTARTGRELGIGREGEDKSQWQRPDWQQFIGPDSASAQGLAGAGQ